MTDLIRNEDDWLDLRVGEEAIVRARFDFATASGIVVSFSDWSQLSIESLYGNELRHLLGDDIELRIIRTEDGLLAEHEHIIEANSKHGL